MGRGTATRDRIVAEAASLFNQKGFTGASVSDLMEATGLQKGGIYRHFDSKESLAIEAFDYAVGRMGDRLRRWMQDVASPVDRLKVIVAVFAGLLEEPPIPGGCPIMNAAIENDDGNRRLRDRSREAMDRLLGLVERAVVEGQAAGEIRPEIEPREVATVMIATLEGAVMLSKLYEEPGYAAHAAAHLERYIEQELRR